MDWKIPLFKLYWDDEDVRAVTEVITRGMYWAIGPNIEKFEEKLADYVGTKYALTFNSGTSALHSVLMVYGMGEGDEVIVPSFTFITTANAPLFVGAKTVFADIEETTFGLNPADVAKKITQRTKAIIPVHYGGCPCLIHELKKVAEEHNLLLIEDAAESLGAVANGEKAGSLGDCAIFSLCAPKVITTGEGGFVVTDSADLYEKLKLVRSHGRAETENYFSTAEYMDYIALGYNFRMSDMTAALGITQLEKIEKIIEMRQRNAAGMSERLSGISEILLPDPPEGFRHIYQMYVIRVKEGQKKRDALMAYLNKKGIMAKVYFYPVHLSYFYRQKLGYTADLPATDMLSRQVLTLPMYPTLEPAEMDYIADSIKEFFPAR